MDLDIGPVSSITSVKYLDSTGAEQTLSSAVYTLISESLPPRLVLKTGQSWPATYSADNAVRIRFVAGYGAASAVPGERGGLGRRRGAEEGGGDHQRGTWKETTGGPGDHRGNGVRPGEKPEPNHKEPFD
jgi:hypothetical protein